MSPAFSSWAAFFAMGGYAFYVWLSVGVTLLTLAGLLLHTVLQRRQVIAAVRRREARETRIRASKTVTPAAAASAQESSQ
ncbi:heme exporter protein CcmD [Chimaeribacter arupi]|uniref:Heme exporter protein D n=2 Tax=Yersiniaceae TaxID=1903411 RepID=A0A2N5EQ17_9GAMM|nr:MULTISPECIES: heme exporter protein CcmD [Yersiniaceae]MBS0970322.1 heme exporter protein CcmD [Nissabacter archeti]MDV5140428.1 heme exporter protein CcmD [Chimaeribacter arupi]PLR50013.1 heme exporter protein CcmD [Chimaeribacter arupi]PLR50527.1 heme exporter protein CcmD [Chimaeribacter arupi]PLR51511.1 heme exporter protein CcmD [Chimaeribacter arupi]